MNELLEYSIRVTPGVVLLTALYWLIRKKSLEFKLVILVLGFILLRDVMTPLGFWEFNLTDSSVPWVRFTDNSFLLATLGFSSLMLTAFIVTANKSMSKLIKWGDISPRTILTGLIGALLVVLPLILMYQFIPLSERGGVVAMTVIPALLFMSLAGNFMEEVLFRGYLQGYFEKGYGAFRAAIISGLLFAAGHIFLATTVTDLGVVILLFTLYEGLVCAFVRNKQGIIASTITHGLAIFILASGI